MALLSGAPIVERWLDQVIISANAANIDGERVDTIALPDGLGDVAIMEAMIVVDNVATIVGTPEAAGAIMQLISAAANRVDFVGRAEFRRHNISGHSCYFSPDPLVLWQQNELVQIQFPELDTNATPTADLSVVIKCVRVRPTPSAPGPTRLVR